MSNEDPHHPHDSLFKAVFKDKKQVIGYLNFFLPEKLVSQLDLSTLKLHDTSYLDEVLKKTFSDICYTCILGKEKEKVLVSLLFEHKSNLDQYVHFQLLEYMIRVWQHQRTNKQKPTVVIPIVFYHGEKKWKMRSFESFFGKNISPELLAYLPKFEYIFTDLAHYDSKALERLKTYFLLYSLLAMSSSGDRATIKQILFNIYKVRNLKQKQQLIKYIATISVFETAEIFNLARAAELANKNNDIMSTLEKLLKLGEEKGIEKGKILPIKNLHEEGFSVARIAKVLNVTEDFVEKVLAGKITEESI